VKRPWSKRKDLILEYYLTPYLPKVWTLRRPILLVDGFAGPGVFKDGNPGSPVIICNKVKEAKEAIARGVSAKVLCIENVPSLYTVLESTIRPYASFAETRFGDFVDFLPLIEDLAKTHTIFLYLDPYTVEGLEWTALERVFRHLSQSRSSIEVLVNFSAVSFARRGRSALAIAQDTSETDIEPDNMTDGTDLGIDRLNLIVGGDWWQSVLMQHLRFPEEVAAIANGFCEKLRLHFREVCQHNVKEHWNHKVPKYTLVFGSRSPDALLLMNDAAARSREKFAESEIPSDGLLFETRPRELVPDFERLTSLVMDFANTRLTRGALILKIIRSAFGDYRETEIRRTVTHLIAKGLITSATGKSRINNDVEVWRPRQNST